ncbi:putative nuclease HARBI1 [Saccostrea echinata]|uniref:putative nuclease HARBI1 n=1 Tax=Saccostrea echinata TaxID=191078 RepID=UPI002A7FA13F|nr:putative nuclease HARBI1 [Saccostrea echinata]
MAAQRRNFRERRDYFNEYSDMELVKRFRLDSAGINFVEGLIGNEIRSASIRNHALTSTVKVLLTLRFLATGKMQLCNGDDMGVSQSSVSRAVSCTIRSLSSDRMVRRFIKFPTSPDAIRRNQEHFFQIAGFPGIVGAIDGTHVQIIAPRNNENEFVNRHHYHSLNVQVVFDTQYKLIDIVAKWPASTHDARILNESGLRVLFENGHIPVHTHLLGDSGYPSRRWLLTPFRIPQPGPQTNSNNAHKRTRSIVERGIGQLKRRFHVLHGEIRLSPQKACQVVIACAVLHNICKDRQIPIPADDDDDDSNDEDDSDDYAQDHMQAGNDGAARGNNINGTLYRQQFAETHF